MKLSEVLSEQYISINELNRIKIAPDEVLLIKIGVDGLSQQQIYDIANEVARTFRENLPKTKMIVTTVSKDRPLDLFVVDPNEAETLIKENNEHNA